MLAGMELSLKRTPPAVCDNCGRFAMWLGQCEAPCNFCHVGKFVHNWQWVFWECPACHWTDPFCAYCHGKGIIASPKEQEDR